MAELPPRLLRLGLGLGLVLALTLTLTLTGPSCRRACLG